VNDILEGNNGAALVFSLAMPSSFSFSSFNARRTAANDALNLSSVNGITSNLSGNVTGYHNKQGRATF
jgi:hypothetical protein